MFDYLEAFGISALLRAGSVVDFDRRRLSRPHPSDRKKKGGKAKARRRAKGKRLHRRK